MNSIARAALGTDRAFHLPRFDTAEVVVSLNAQHPPMDLRSGMPKLGEV
jgi:hypothetical protein